MYEFWYDYLKPKYGKKSKLLYGYRQIQMIHCIHKKHDIYKDIAENVETRFDTSNYELECNSIERLLPKGKNKNVIGLKKDELDGKIRTKFVRLRANIFSYLIDDGSEDKKAKGTKKCVIKKT